MSWTVRIGGIGELLSVVARSFGARRGVWFISGIISGTSHALYILYGYSFLPASMDSCRSKCSSHAIDRSHDLAWTRPEIGSDGRTDSLKPSSEKEVEVECVVRQKPSHLSSTPANGGAQLSQSIAHLTPQQNSKIQITLAQAHCRSSTFDLALFVQPLCRHRIDSLAPLRLGRVIGRLLRCGLRVAA